MVQENLIIYDEILNSFIPKIESFLPINVSFLKLVLLYTALREDSFYGFLPVKSMGVFNKSLGKHSYLRSSGLILDFPSVLWGGGLFFVSFCISLECLLVYLNG